MCIRDRGEDAVCGNLDKHVFFLNVPTGGGKTNLSMRLALRIMEKLNTKKIFYVFPFINIIEQAYESLEKYVPPDTEGLSRCIRLDSKAPVVSGTRSDDLTDEALKEISLSLSFMNYPVLFLSNVKFFDLFFRNDKGANYNFYHLANSIVILDEIQSYDDKLWTLLAEILFKSARALNMYVIVMSATLPRLNELIRSENEKMGVQEDISLCEVFDEGTRKEIFSHPCFNRCRYDFSFLKKKYCLPLTAKK